MIDLLKQPPNLRLSVKLCKTLYDKYLLETSVYFSLPTFEQRYPGKIEGILGSVSQSYGNVYLFETIEACAAAYFVKISTQHPFPDGNKRMAVYLTDVFLSANEVNLLLDWKEMYELAKLVVIEKENGVSHDLLEKVVAKIIRENV